MPPPPHRLAAPAPPIREAPASLPGLRNPAALDAGDWTLPDFLAGIAPAHARLRCPFHDDHHPTAKVLPGAGRLWCFRCGVAEDRLGVALRLLFPERGGHHYTPTERELARDWLRRQGYGHVQRAAPGAIEPAKPAEPDLIAAMTALGRSANEFLRRAPQVIATLQETRGLRDPVGLGLGLAHWRLLPRIDEVLTGEVRSYDAKRADLLFRAGVLTDPEKATPEKPQRWALADRLVLPEWRQGKVVFYQARSRDNDKIKYRSPRTPKQLWGLETLARPTRVVWVTEGVFDALPLVEQGESVIATLGIHLAEVGLENLKTAVGDRLVVLCYDNDAPDAQGVRAGETQARTLAARMSDAGIRSAVAAPPAGIKDLSAWATRASPATALAALRFAP